MFLRCCRNLYHDRPCAYRVWLELNGQRSLVQAKSEGKYIGRLLQKLLRKDPRTQKNAYRTLNTNSAPIPLFAVTDPAGQYVALQISRNSWEVR